MRHRDKGSAIFLMELVIAILFFSMCAAVCLSMFGRSADIALRSAALNEAVVRSSSLAEVFKEEQGSLEGMADLMAEMDTDAASVTLSDSGAGLQLDYEDMTLLLEPEGPSTAVITARAAGNLAERGTFSADDDEIYSLKVRCAHGR